MSRGLRRCSPFGAGIKAARGGASLSFEEGGSLAALDLVVTYGQGHTKGDHLMFRNYGCAVVDPPPEVDGAYDEMEADMQLKLDAFEKQLEAAEGPEAEEVK